jgi:quercetin dioxygenase-like cupin family protein
MAKIARRRATTREPGRGRVYDLGRGTAVFKDDGSETAGKYSISEWWLEPHTKGPGAHSHDEDDVFYVLEGTMSLRIGARWIDAPKGSLVLAPGGVVHDFENRTSKRAGFLNVSVPGDFEPHMDGIAAWFRARSGSEATVAARPRLRRPARSR